jgi:hypothetical protein
MSLEYTLALADGLNAESVCNLLAKSGEFRADGGQLEAPELVVSICAPSTLSRQIIAEGFHFEPALELTFRLDKFKDRDRALRRILAGVAEVLRAAPVDLSLVFNGETVVLTRLAGALALHDIPGFWTEGRLALMPEPRQRLPARTI